MTGRPRRDISERDVDVALAMYRQLGTQIAELEEHIRGLRHKQDLVIKMMRDTGLSYRQIGPLIHRSSSRAHQLAGNHENQDTAPC